jgi:hypothetical protein
MPARLPLEARANLRKAREAALLAVETYNRPGTIFRSANYIVLMIIAWTALFHAIFAKRKIKPFYRKKNSRRFERIDGDYRTWELAECLRQFFKDANPPRRKNLELFIALRNKIEHRFLPELDADIFGECQAMIMNVEALLCEEFGDRHALAASLAFALQFSKVTTTGQQRAMREAAKQQLQSVRKYVDRFRSSLDDDVAPRLATETCFGLVPRTEAARPGSPLSRAGNGKRTGQLRPDAGSGQPEHQQGKRQASPCCPRRTVLSAHTQSTWHGRRCSWLGESQSYIQNCLTGPTALKRVLGGYKRRTTADRRSATPIHGRLVPCEAGCRS